MYKYLLFLIPAPLKTTCFQGSDKYLACHRMKLSPLSRILYTYEPVNLYVCNVYRLSGHPGFKAIF